LGSPEPIPALPVPELLQTSGDPFALVVPEVLGDVVSPIAARKTRAGWRIDTRLPSAPGLYALSVRLHDDEGVALDEASQGLVPRLLVRVVGPTSALIVAPDQLEVRAASPFTLPAAVRNTGRTAWAQPQPVTARSHRVESPGPVRVTAHWLPLGREAAATHPPEDGSSSIGHEVRPGDELDVRVPLTAPTGGTWLLVLDVETPETPSLVAAGSPPSFVRVLVDSNDG
jgi:hypothetical protein